MLRNLTKSIPIYISIIISAAASFYFAYLCSYVTSYNMWGERSADVVGWVVLTIGIILTLIFSFFLGKRFLCNIGSFWKNFLSVLPAGLVIAVIAMIILRKDFISNASVAQTALVFIIQMIFPILLTIGIQSTRKHKFD